jgi:hypothetical protein
MIGMAEDRNIAAMTFAKQCPHLWRTKAAEELETTGSALDQVVNNCSNTGIRRWNPYEGRVGRPRRSIARGEARAAVREPRSGKASAFDAAGDLRDAFDLSPTHDVGASVGCECPYIPSGRHTCREQLASVRIRVGSGYVDVEIDQSRNGPQTAAIQCPGSTWDRTV